MTPENTDKLFNKYPTFFRPNLGLRRSLMGFGFECGDGWFGILDRLFDSISKVNPPEHFEVFQVKEKFGGLRVYTIDTPDRIYDLITAAEEESYKTCEVCGAPGRPREGNWISTLCDGCADQRNK